MNLPVVRGVLERRMLVNYRVRPEVLAGLLPPPLLPKVAGGFGIAGICLIRLRDIRPRSVRRRSVSVRRTQLTASRSCCPTAAI